MKFRVLTDEMNYGMGMVSRAVPARAIYPSMEGVFIENCDEGLQMTCTNGEMTIRANIPVTMEEDGYALLPAKLFGEIMRKQPAGEVSVSVDSSLKTVIKAYNSTMKLMGMETEDFPEIDEVSSENRVSIPCSVARQAIGRVMFAVSTDESRKILTGVLMEATDENIVFVGLDGFRLALQRIDNKAGLPESKKGSKISCVVPGTVMNEISHMLPDDEDKNLEITFTSSRVSFRFDNISVYATLLAGEFIDYKKILPASSTTMISVARTQISDAIDRCSLMAREGKNNLIHLSIKKDAEGSNDGTLIMTSNAEKGDAHEEISIGIEGKELDIAFNAKYLTDVVHNVDDETLIMCFNSNASPCMLKPVEGDKYRFLVLPVRVFNK